MSKNFEFKRSLNIFKAEFKMRFKGTIIWLALIVGMMAMYMLMYPVIDDIMGEKLALMPEELLQIFGMSKHSVVDNYNSYFAMIYQIIFIILCCYGVSMGANALYDEEKTKSIEFLNSVQVSRLEIYVGKFLVIMVNLLILVMGSLITTILCGLVVGEGTVDNMAIISVYKISGITLFFFVALGFFLASFLKKDIKPSMAGLSILFVTYIIGYLGELVADKIEFIKMLSPIHITSASAIMDSTMGIGTLDYNLLPVAIITLLMFGFIVGGAVLYRKRDFL
ncbi:MAG: ABC transporter permease subunit [Bacilli bacterium]|jgi:ABC-type transport system involved in multi-copper enzyme maturation permease subunit|nr:ABC transporter permease subunit [Bacilli bacterium]